MEKTCHSKALFFGRKKLLRVTRKAILVISYSSLKLPKEDSTTESHLICIMKSILTTSRAPRLWGSKKQRLQSSAAKKKVPSFLLPDVTKRSMSLLCIRANLVFSLFSYQTAFSVCTLAWVLMASRKKRLCVYYYYQVSFKKKAGTASMVEAWNKLFTSIIMY